MKSDAEKEAYAEVVASMKKLASAVDAYAAIASDEDKAGWLTGWLEQVEIDFLDFAMEFEGVDSSD